jgi:drug/metabolite transporter (DMT)-like permease
VRAATLAGCGAIGLWAVLALLSRAASGLPPLQLTAMSFAVSGGLGLAWLAARRRLLDLRQPPLAWLHGVGGLFGFHALYFASLARAPAATANLINYTWPLLLVLLSAALLGMRLTWRHGLGTVLALSGCAMLLGGGAAFPAGAALGYARRRPAPSCGHCTPCWPGASRRCRRAQWPGSAPGRRRCPAGCTC